MGQADVGPIGFAGIKGAALLTTTTNIFVALVPQEFEALTVIFPPTALPFVETVTVLVVAPDVIVHPKGNVQL